MFIKRLHQALDSLTDSEEQIAQYISAHLDEIGKITSAELAQRTGTAQATVIRFSKKLGYPGYKRMINDINTSVADEHIDDEIKYDDDIETSKIKLRTEYDIVFDLISDQNPNSCFERASRFLAEADKVLLFSITSRKQDILHYFAGQLSKIGINAITDSHSSYIYSVLETCKKGDVIFLISETGETREILNFAKIAKKRDIKVISITRLQKNRLQALSDVNFRCIEYGQRTFLRNIMSMHSFLIIIDRLYIELIKLDPEKSEKLSARNSLVTKVNYVEN